MAKKIFRPHCPNCGGGIEETDIYCLHCGMNLDTSLEKTELETLAQENLENARILLESGRNLKKALASCEQAIEYTPGSASAEAHNLRGLILDGLERKSEAISEYREALRLEPDFAEAKANLEDALTENSHAQLKNMHGSASQPKRSWKIIALVAGMIGLVVCVAAGAGFLSIIKPPLLTPRATVVFEPDRGRVSSVTQADLEQTAMILKQRWAALGYPATSFTVSNNAQIIGRIPANVDPDLINLTKAVGIVEFVDFGTTYYEAGHVVNTDFPGDNVLQGAGTKWHTIMTNAEIKTVSASRDQSGNFAIDFTLTEKGTKILADYTTQNIGNYLGIIVDKAVISCPNVNAGITQGKGIISGGFTEQTAQTLAAYMRYTPLPIPLK